MTRELAWKPRCAVIMLVNVDARSTLDISIAPACVAPRPLVPGVPVVFGPELDEVIHSLPPWRSRPDEFANVASARRYGVTRVWDTGSIHETPPVWSMATPVAPVGTWIATLV